MNAISLPHSALFSFILSILSIYVNIRSFGRELSTKVIHNKTAGLWIAHKPLSLLISPSQTPPKRPYIMEGALFSPRTSDL